MMVPRRRNNQVGFRRSAFSSILSSRSVRSAASKAIRHVRKQAANPKSKTSFQRKLGPTRNLSLKSSTKSRILRDTDTFNEDMGSGGEITSMNVSSTIKGSGNPRKKTQHLVRDNAETEIFRYGALNTFMNITASNINNVPFFSCPGAYALTNYNANNSNLYAPLHMYDVTSLNNAVNNTIVNYNPGYHLIFNSNLGATNAFFSNLPCKLNDGSLGGSWFYENVSGSNSSVDIYPKKASYQDYFQARMLCYGASTFATQYAIDVVQLRDDFMHPDLLSGSASNLPGGSVSTGNYRASTLGFYEYLTKPFIAHPLQEINPAFRKHIKILKSLRFTLQPRLSNETDNPTGHCKKINLFVRLNRKCRYDWIEGGSDPNLQGVNTYISEQGQVACITEPKSRIYLMVRALAQPVASPATPTLSNTPSYDLLLRSKHTWLSG